MQTIVEGYENQFRNMVGHDFYANALMEIPQIVTKYGARVDSSGGVLEECIRLIKENWMHLGYADLEAAYRMWAAGELETTGRAEFWGGEFNAAQFGAVVGAYDKKRRKVLAGYIREKLEHQEAEAKKEEAERRRALYAESFEDCIRRAVVIDPLTGNEYAVTSWEKVPPSWYDTAKERGKIELSEEEKKEYWQRAKGIAEIEAGASVEEAIENGKIFQVAALREAKTEAGIRARAEIIGKKLIVFEKLIKAK